MNQQLNNEVNHLLLNAARIRLGWSIEKAAEECDVPFQTVKNVLTGKTRNPRADTLTKLASGLGIPQEELYQKNENNLIKEEIIEEVEKEAIQKTDEVSVIALKEIYEHQITVMKETNEAHIKNIREHYERHIAEIKEHYEKRLVDKREHIETIIKDKKMFQLASVFGVLALLGLFFFIEFMTPGHGWFR